MRSKFPFALLLACAVAFACWVLYSGPLLPDKLATHFSVGGAADGWMSRDDHLMMITFLGYGLPALVIGLCIVVRFIPPRLLNVPHADYWRSPAHYPEACGILIDWSYLYGAVHLVWTGVLNALIVSANRAVPPQLDTTGVFVLSGVYLAAVAALVVWLIFRFLRVPAGEKP